jgi:anti-sigma-K factor RskA
MDEQVHLLTGAYVLDALDPDERAAFEAHLETCRACSAEVRQLQTTATRLAEGVAVPLPPSLKVRVLEEVAQTRQLPPVVPPPTTLPDASRRRAARRAWTTRALAAAAAIAVVAAVGLGALARHLADERSDLSARTQAINSVLTAPDAHTVSAPVAGSNARAAVIVSDSLGRAVLVANNLQAPPSGRIYQLWFIDSKGQARSAGTFKPGPDGNAAQPLAGTVGNATTVGMTVEPKGGSRQPTTTPTVAVPIA